jgi:nicotinamidase-related amidase
MADHETVLLIIDVQRDLAAPGGALYHPKAAGVIPAIVRLRKGARRRRWPVVYTRQVHEGRVFRPKGKRPWCLQGKPGVEIVPELKPARSELVVRKRTYNAFFGTELDPLIRGLGVRRLVLSGLYSHTSVLLTAGDGALLGYEIILPVDATFAPTDFDHQAALREVSFLYRGTLTTTRELLSAPGEGPLESSVSPNLEVRPPALIVKRRVRLPAAETALVVVDMQNDFARRGGALFVPGTRETIAPIQGLLKKAREKGVMTVFTQDWHLPGDPEFRIWGPHAQAGTPGAEVIRPLSPRPRDALIQKLTYDAFHGTSLDLLLRREGIRNVLVVGTVSNICVLHTAGKASLYGYRVVVAEDGVSSLSPFDQALALRQVAEVYGGTVTRAAYVSFDGTRPQRD